MAEPAGIAFKLNISETDLNNFLKCKQASTENFIEIGENEHKTNPKNKVSQFMAELLYSCNNQSQNVFLFQYNTEKKELFFAYILNYNWTYYANAVLSILKQASTFQDLQKENYALCFSPISFDFYSAFSFQKGNTINRKQDIANSLLQEYIDEVWFHFDKKADCFPEPAKAIRKKNYFYRTIILAYKKYLKIIEEQEKPEKIRKATTSNPFCLFDWIYTWEGKIYNCLYGTDIPIEFLHADPLTFKKVGSVYADKNYVYKCSFDNIVNNSYCFEKGIDGATYQVIGGNSMEYLFTKDKNHIYLEEKVLLEADVRTFKVIDFAYGKDKSNVYYRDKIIPINPTEYKIDKHGFIRDKNNIFHYEEKIEMNAITFKVLKYENDVNPFIGVFVLEDKNGIYEYNSINKAFKKI